MSPTRALKSLLQAWHLREDSGRDVLAARTFWAALFSYAAVFLCDSAHSAPLATALRQCGRSWASFSQDSVLMLNVFTGILEINQL